MNDNCVQKDPKKRIAEIEKEIEELENKQWSLRQEKEELQKEFKSWFIGNIFKGDGDYWDEYLCPLGFVTEEYAIKWVNDHNDYCDTECWMGSAPAYFEVTREEFKLYLDWQALSKAQRCLLYHTNSSFDDLKASMDKAIDDVVSKLSNEKVKKYRSFIHISANKED